MTHVPESGERPRAALDYESTPDANVARTLSALAIVHRVLGSLMLLAGVGSIVIACGGLADVAMPGGYWTGPDGAYGPPPKPSLGAYVRLGGGLASIAGGLVLGLLNFSSARAMGEADRRDFSVRVSVANCLWFPLGTAVGIPTLVALARESTKRHYLHAERTRLRSRYWPLDPPNA